MDEVKNPHMYDSLEEYCIYCKATKKDIISTGFIYCNSLTGIRPPAYPNVAFNNNIVKYTYFNTQRRIDFCNEFMREHCFNVMASKGKEYSRSEDDVNSNFKRTGDSVGIEPLKVCAIFMNKHHDAIMNYIKTGKVESENINSRIGDMINYLLILATLIEEEKQNAQTPKL